MTPINRFTVSFVGAGPGDVELITVKGRRLLDAADVIIHAGSLVNRELLDGCTADIHDSSGLNLDEIVELMVAAWQKGLRVVRLHTGDPSIYGAIREQMVRLEAASIPCEVIPGVSSAFAAAASLKAELTLPEVAQTVIITRQEGRTPVPAREKLSLLASHQTTMLIFLSAGLLATVVEELRTGGYPGDTPVVIVERASWENEKIVRGTLATICAAAAAQQIRKTAMICVGRVFDRQPPEAVSKLYDRHFSHGTREAKDD
ncbi:MAG: precorrin-4 C(11)-methyltransferase [Desulfoprunum sp.]|jgi:precorrin-4/cobalt-precorrin-4 C11-methyltransferase|uniref:precorrin-4 C(11)-methyltransferase n=1 Tax=Desulfoprunum sp. TaxID=2020866 RepID=UPI00052DE15A|nr:cobalt-precorrin-4 C(11)-methyltransferase [Desulfobulbus sp. Tol-SR]